MTTTTKTEFEVLCDAYGTLGMLGSDLLAASIQARALLIAGAKSSDPKSIAELYQASVGAINATTAKLEDAVKTLRRAHDAMERAGSRSLLSVVPPQ